MSWALDDDISSKPSTKYWDEGRPKLTKKEIEKAAEVYKTFVDPRNQSYLYHVFKRKCHSETFNAWWKLVCGHNRNPVDHPYTVDQYILDKKIATKNN